MFVIHTAFKEKYISFFLIPICEYNPKIYYFWHFLVASSFTLYNFVLPFSIKQNISNSKMILTVSTKLFLLCPFSHNANIYVKILTFIS